MALGWLYNRQLVLTYAKKLFHRSHQAPDPA
jgi:hypothetical protein